MIDKLIESSAEVPKRRGGTMVSVFIHTVIVGAAIVATARPTIGRLRPEPPKVIIFAVPDPPKRPQPEQRRTPLVRTISGPPSLYHIDAPRVIPTEIPPIDLSVAPTSIDFNERRATTPGCYLSCQVGSATGDTAGSPLLMGAELAMRLQRQPVPPRYPEALRAAGIDGSVMVKFVVDTTGRVDMQSVEIISSTHELFTAAVRETLTKLRFYPSELNGKKVRAAAQMPFLFTLKE